jgi:hypothetical protein
MGSSSTCEPARTSNDRSTGTRAARNMPPVISTIVMSRLFARRERTSMSAYFTNSLTPPTGLGLLGIAPRQGFSGSGSARLGLQKDGLPTCRGGAWFFIGSRPSTRAQGRAAPSLPLSNREQEWTPRRATLLCSPPCRSFAQALPGLWITLFSARPFLRSAQLGYSA